MENDEMLIKTYNINNKDYYVINEIDHNQTHYLFLSNKLDIDDMMIRKVIGGYLQCLDNENEVKEVLQLINKS